MKHNNMQPPPVGCHTHAFTMLFLLCLCPQLLLLPPQLYLCLFLFLRPQLLLLPPHLFLLCLCPQLLFLPPHLFLLCLPLLLVHHELLLFLHLFFLFLFHLLFLLLLRLLLPLSKHRIDEVKCSYLIVQCQHVFFSDDHRLV
jgi:hypothetical protein